MKFVVGVYLQIGCWAAVLVIFGDGADCRPRDVAKLADEIGTVDWKTLADWLDVDHQIIQGIETKCLRDGGDLAKCYRRDLVWAFCQSTGGTVDSVREKMAEALEKNMKKKLQADNIRRLNLGENLHTCSSDNPDCTASRPSIIFHNNWEGLEPGERDLEFFSYRADNGEKTGFRLLQQIQGKCRDIGTQLGIINAVLKSYGNTHIGNPIGFCREVFAYWREEGSADYPFTWGSVLRILETIQQTQIAKKLKNALSSKM